jgi:TM2 domain-containing membrane protein YozV
MNEAASNDVSTKKRLYALLFCVFFGWAGLHRFYVDKIGTGFAMLFTFGGFGMWVPVDIVLILFGFFKDSEDKAVKDWL